MSMGAELIVIRYDLNAGAKHHKDNDAWAARIGARPAPGPQAIISG